MADVRKYEFEEVQYTLEPGIVRVRSEEPLKGLLKKKMKAAGILSERILAAYCVDFGRELEITRNSLAVEIYLHFKVQQACLKMMKLFGKRRLLNAVLRHTEIIDCGEKHRDNNRFLWDILAWFAAKFRISGR